MSRQRIGVFGGSFNPVHKGHVAVARAFMAEVGLDMLYVIPTNISPLKDTLAASGEDRLNMLRIAFEGVEGAILSDLELERKGVSYTCDTVKALRGIYPKARLYYLIGDDWLKGFTRWREYGYILDNVRLTVANRSGRDISAEVREFNKETGKRALVMKNKAVVVSSSDFRTCADPELLPAGVYEYIKERGLYGL